MAATLRTRLVMLIRMVVGLVALCPCATAAEFFVSPRGDDRGTGTEGEPFATIQRAQRAVRDLKAAGRLTTPVTVTVRAGTYCLHEPLVFTPRDSGTVERPVTYRAASGETVVISGGKRLTGFTAKGKLWTTMLPEVKAGTWAFNQLYVNGRRRTRARTPNAGSYSRIRSPLSDKRESRRAFRYRAGDVREWEDLAEAVFVVYGSWYNSIHHVAELDSANRVVRFTNPAGRPFGWYERNLRYYVENIAAGLDQPGEWHLNRETGVLSYYPLPGETIETAEVVAPVVAQTLVRFQGEPGKDRYVEHIHLEGLQFRHTDAHLPRDLYDARQAATVQEAGITADAARQCAIENCEVANMGEHGIWLRDDCHHNTVRRCHVHDLGGGGIYIGEKWRWGNDCPGWPGYRSHEDIPHVTEHNLVDNCFIHDGCHLFTGAVGVWVGQASHTAVSHNDICDMSYSGVSVGWDWGGHESTAHHNRIENNRIHHIGHRRMNDMAGIYTLGVSPGTVLRRNLIHDVQAYQSSVGYCLGAGIYLDQSAAGIRIENNVCFNIDNAGFFLHYGVDNSLVNNVFADLRGLGRLGWGMVFTARKDRPDHGNSARGNIVCSASPKAAKVARQGRGGPDSEEDRFVTLGGNLYCCTGDGEPTFSLSHHDEADAVVDLAAWQAAGQDTRSTVADPLFVDPAAQDYRLRPESPARALGIRSIDMSEVGLYGDRAWTELPKRVRYREPDPEAPFVPSRILVLNEDFEGQSAGYVPDRVQFTVPEEGAVVEVTDAVAASGSKCLRFVDVPGLAQVYHPNRVWRDLAVHEGAVKVEFDCMNSAEKPATFYVELRDWTEKQIKAGPTMTFQPGGYVRVGKDLQFACEPGRWYHVEIAFELGESAPKTYRFSFAPRGQTAEPVTIPFIDAGFRTLTWLGLVAMDSDRHSEFYIDNLRVDME